MTPMCKSRPWRPACRMALLASPSGLPGARASLKSKTAARDSGRRPELTLPAAPQPPTPDLSTPPIVMILPSGRVPAPAVSLQVTMCN